MAVDLGVMTINVWSGLTYRGAIKMGAYETPDRREQRFQALVAEIERLRPDVIGINEANPLPQYAARLARVTGYDCIWRMGVSGLRLGRWGVPVNLREGDAILARKGLGLHAAGGAKLGGFGFVGKHCSLHTGDLTQVVLGRLTVAGMNIYTAVTHWHLAPRFENDADVLGTLKHAYGYSAREHRRARRSLARDKLWKTGETLRMASWLRQNVPQGAPLIVMGDFNAAPDWPEMRHLIGQDLSDAGPLGAYTWDPEHNENLQQCYPRDLHRRFDTMAAHLKALFESVPQRIDYILVNKRCAVLASELCARNQENGPHPSDHFGVHARVRIQE